MSSDAPASLGHVLIVDDDDAVRSAFARTLRLHGMEVREARSGAEALTRIEAHTYDAVLSDIAMPQMDGIALLSAVRGLDLDVPVLLITGAPALETAIGAVRLGALDYLAKPIAGDALAAATLRAIRLGRLARLKRIALEEAGATGHRAGDRAGLVAAFDRCLRGLWVAFQPIVNTSGAIAGYEALLRSREPAFPHPGAVLDAAEALGRVEQLGRNVRQQVAAVAETMTADLYVNLHATEIMDDTLLDRRGGLGRFAERVVLEITERAAIADATRARERIDELRCIGYRIAVDDLGAGYAGLSSFTTLDPDVCKLDISLVRDVDLLPKRRKLVETMTQLCVELEMRVVAEGVERVEELQVLRECGCHYFQGFLLGRPGPALPRSEWPLPPGA